MVTSPLRVRRALAKPELLPSAVAQLLREQIVDGSLAPGSRLVEAALAETLEVSRGTIRDALKDLETEGLIENRPRRGTYVVELGPDDVREVYDLRAAIEMRAIRLIVQRGSPGTRPPELAQVLERIQTAVKAGDARRAMDLDLAFHTELYRLSGNRRLLAVFLRLLPMIRLVLRSRHQLYPTLADVSREHEPLLDAIASGSAEAAEAAINEHLAYARDLLVEHVSERGHAHGSGRSAPLQR
jgi:GntR family transcriptional regulator of gluconate operon